MSAEKVIKKGTVLFGLMLTACTGGLAGGSLPAVAAGQGLIGSSIVAGGTFDEGYQLGLRNGRILAERLRKRTVDLSGCEAIDQFENALLRVTSSVRPSLRDSDSVVAGFFSGYLDSIRNTVADVRSACGVSEYTNGEFAGQLVGAVACQVETISVSAISSLQLQPLYSGWSGGSSSVQASCRESVLATVQSCSSGAELVASISAIVQVSCSDSVSP